MKKKEVGAALRFGMNLSAVYFNPTERCNLDCSCCYIPETMRREGKHMSSSRLIEALGILSEYFGKHLPRGTRPQIVFHGSEPMLCRDAVFAGIEKHRNDFRFGVQTNGTLLDDEAIGFLTSRGVGIGLSPDGHLGRIADRNRKTWGGDGTFRKVRARRVEEIDPCSRCAVRHFCGSPCPAEAHGMNGAMQRPGAFCELYEEQVRYALRLIADGKEDAYLRDGWDAGMSASIEMGELETARGR